jgi:WD40 repeat protein
VALVTSVAFSPDGRLIASGSKDKTIKLWDVKTGEEIRTLKGHSSWVNSVTFSPDGRLIASGSEDKTIKLWDVKTGERDKDIKGA